MASARKDSLALRFLTATIGVPLLVAFVWFGVLSTALLATVATVIAGVEFIRLGPSPRSAGVTAVSLTVGVLFVADAATQWGLSPLLVAMAVLVPLFATLISPRDKRSIDAWTWAVAGAFLIGWTLSLVVLLRQEEFGREWVLTAVGLTFANDTGAYFVGRAFGKRKLAPTISPGKTWEGAIGGLGMAAVAAIILTTAFRLEMPVWQVVLLGVTVSVAAQMGDLAESLIKRAADAKDAGTTIPGHGGLLDRLDSLIPVFAVIYFFVAYLE